MPVRPKNYSLTFGVEVAECCIELHFIFVFRMVGCFLDEYRSIYNSVQEPDKYDPHLVILIPVSW